MLFMVFFCFWLVQKASGPPCSHLSPALVGFSLLLICQTTCWPMLRHQGHLLQLWPVPASCGSSSSCESRDLSCEKCMWWLFTGWLRCKGTFGSTWPNSCSSRDTQGSVPRPMSTWLLELSKDGDIISENPAKQAWTIPDKHKCLLSKVFIQIAACFWLHAEEVGCSGIVVLKIVQNLVQIVLAYCSAKETTDIVFRLQLTVKMGTTVKTANQWKDVVGFIFFPWWKVWGQTVEKCILPRCPC